MEKYNEIWLDSRYAVKHVDINDILKILPSPLTKSLMDRQHYSTYNVYQKTTKLLGFKPKKKNNDGATESLGIRPKKKHALQVEFCYIFKCLHNTSPTVSIV